MKGNTKDGQTLRDAKGVRSWNYTNRVRNLLRSQKHWILESHLSIGIEKGDTSIHYGAEMIRPILLLSLGSLLSGCVTEQLRVNTDWMIGEKPRINAIIVLDKKDQEEDKD